MKENTKEALTGVGGCLLMLCFFVGAVFLFVMFLKGAVWVGEHVYPWLSLLSVIAFFVTLLVLFPLAIFRKTRGFAGVGLYSVSYLFGVTLWMTGLLLTYAVWGLTAVIIGLLLLLGGVVPFAIVATAINGMWPPFWNLLFLLVLTYGCRMVGFYFISKAEEPPRPPKPALTGLAKWSAGLLLSAVALACAFYAGLEWSRFLPRKTDPVKSYLPPPTAGFVLDPTPKVATAIDFQPDKPPPARKELFDDIVSRKNTGGSAGPNPFAEFADGSTTPAKLIPDAPKLIELPCPNSGVFELLTEAERVAPLQIKTSPGNNYLVKLVQASSQDAVMTIFVRGGEMVEVDVPLGTYEVRYACGTSWYGRERLFGPTTSYCKADESFYFYTTGNKVNGYTVTLYKVANGNLETSSISADQF